MFQIEAITYWLFKPFFPKFESPDFRFGSRPTILVSYTLTLSQEARKTYGWKCEKLFLGKKTTKSHAGHLTGFSRERVASHKY